MGLTLDWTRIEASDAEHATVASADQRRFSTADGGRTLDTPVITFLSARFWRARNPGPSVLTMREKRDTEEPMRRPNCAKSLTAAALAILLCGFLLYTHGRAAQQPGGTSQPSTSQNDQSELSVTVYNSDLALIRDVRDISIPAGTFPTSNSWTSQPR